MKRKITYPMLCIATMSVVTLLVSQPGQSSTAFASQQAQAETAAPKEAIVRLNAAQARKFADTLDALRTQAGGEIALVVEGTPLHPLLSPTAAADLAHSPAPLSEMVAKVAAAYDYEVMRRDNNLFIFAKRYTDPRDLPGVTIGECAAALADVQRILAPYNPQVGYSRDLTSSHPLIADFAPTLTPQQIEQMKAKKLEVSSLSAAQKQMVQRFSMYLFVQWSTDAMEQTVNSIKLASKAEFGFGNVGQRQNLFGFDAVDAYGRTNFRPLDPEPFFRYNSYGVLEPPTPPGPPLPEPTNPDAADAARAATTLGKVVAGLNARRQGGGSSSPAFAVDAALAAKPITVVGADSIAPEQVLTALADIYRLEVRTDPNRREMRLTRRRLTRLPLTAAKIADAVLQALPPSLVRAARIGTTEKPEPEPLSPAQPKNGPPLTPAEWERLGNEYGAKMDAYYKRRRERTPQQIFKRLSEEAVRRLRVATEAELKADPSAKRIPLAQLGDTEQNALVIPLLDYFLQDVRSNYGRGTPLYISRFEDTLLGGGPYLNAKGEHRFVIHFLYPDGSMGPGASDMRYNPRQ